MYELILEVGESIEKNIIEDYTYCEINGNYSSLIKYYICVHLENKVRKLSKDMELS